MSTCSVSGLLTVRNPWGYLIREGHKIVENRHKGIAKYKNKWIALSVSKDKVTSEEVAIWCEEAKRHGDHQRDHELTAILQQVHKAQRGHIIAFIKVSDSVDSEKAKIIDPIYTDYPKNTKCHWVIEDVIPVPMVDYINATGNVFILPSCYLPPGTENVFQKLIRRRSICLDAPPLSIRFEDNTDRDDVSYNHVIVCHIGVTVTKPMGNIYDIAALQMVNGRRTGKSFQIYITPRSICNQYIRDKYNTDQTMLENYADVDIQDAIPMFMNWINDIGSDHKLIGYDIERGILNLNTAIQHCMDQFGRTDIDYIAVDRCDDLNRIYHQIHGEYCSSIQQLINKCGIKSNNDIKIDFSAKRVFLLSKCFKKMFNFNL